VAGFVVSISLLIGFMFALDRLLPQPQPAIIDDVDSDFVQLDAPILPGRHVVFISDFTCDGQAENLEVQREFVQVAGGDLLKVTGIYLTNGVEDDLQTLWEYSLSENGGGYILEPRVLAFDRCKQFVVVPIKTSQPPTSRSLIYRWQNSQMEQVFEMEGWPRGMLSQEIGSATGRCRISVHRYAWVDGEFIRIEVEEKDIRCQKE
jgi:hypothetical protein